MDPIREPRARAALGLGNAACQSKAPQWRSSCDRYTRLFKVLVISSFKLGIKACFAARAALCAPVLYMAAFMVSVRQRFGVVNERHRDGG
jgi:hypothetical protein